MLIWYTEYSTIIKYTLIILVIACYILPTINYYLYSYLDYYGKKIIHAIHIYFNNKSTVIIYKHLYII